MNKTCGNCEHFKKKQFTNVFECMKYHTWLRGKPPIRCQQCLDDEAPAAKQTKPRTKKDYIEVK